MLVSPLSSLPKICNSLQLCFLYKDNLLLTPVVSSEGSLSGSEHYLGKILSRPHCMQLDFRNCNWVMPSPSPRKIKGTVGKNKAFCIDAKPANLSQLIFAQLPDLQKTKDELKWLGTMKWEIHSANVYPEKEKYNPLVSLDHRLETVIRYVKH